MPDIVQSIGSLRDLTPDWLPRGSYGSIGLYSGFTHDYQVIYRTQPNVRTVVDFLARNIAQLGLHVYRRVSETDRVRLSDHPLARLIKRPNAWTTRYRLIHALISDLGIYDNAYWLKVRLPESAPQPFSLLRIPPHLVTIRGGLVATEYRVSLGEKTLNIKPSEIVHFRGYNPDSTLRGLSPLETLRRVLAEEAAAGSYRENFWKNAARMGGVIERPADAPDWGDAARQRFVQEIEAMFSGEANSGKTAVLEDGMTWKPGAFNAEQSQYLEGRKLTREECARAYHVPLPMVGILDHATFSNIESQHKQLYVDCLGPWLKMGEEEIELQLLPEFGDGDDVYAEFNIQEKLAGSFEEQLKSFQAAVGAPWMTRAEARARLNLPALDDPTADELVTPLNVLIGGQASPQDSAPAEGAPKSGLWLPDIDQKAKVASLDPTRPQLRARHRQQWNRVLVRYFARQRDAVEGRLKGRSRAKAAIDDVFDLDRWNRVLKDDLFRLASATALVWARHVAEQLDGDLDEDRLEPFLEENARIAAERINKATRDGIAAALREDEPHDAVRDVFAAAMGWRATQIVQTKVGFAANFGSHEGAKQSGQGTKTWAVNSGNPRSQHAALAGETVSLGKTFTNGMRWPADGMAGLGPEQIANCECSVVFQRSS